MKKRKTKKRTTKRHHYTKPQGPQGRTQTHADAAFNNDAVNHGWSTFCPVTPDNGIDFMIAKEYGAAMVQLKTGTVMSDNRYHVRVDKFPEGPLGWVVYYFQNVNAFFLIPTVDYWQIPRFKKRKTRVFESSKPYDDTMSYETAKRVMGNYEGEKGWDRLERLTSPDGLRKAIEEFEAKKDGGK